MNCVHICILDNDIHKYVCNLFGNVYMYLDSAHSAHARVHAHVCVHAHVRVYVCMWAVVYGVSVCLDSRACNFMICTQRMCVL